MRRTPRRSFLADVAALSVAAAAPGALALPQRGGSAPVRLAANESPEGPSPKALAEAQRALASGHVYPSSRAADELRAEIARRHGVPEASVVLGAGSHEILRLAAGAFAGSTQKRVVA